MNGGENLNLPGMLTVTDYEDEESLEDEMERNVHWRRRQSRQVNRSSISSINGGTMNMSRTLSGKLLRTQKERRLSGTQKVRRLSGASMASSMPGSIHEGIPQMGDMEFQEALDALQQKSSPVEQIVTPKTALIRSNSIPVEVNTKMRDTSDFSHVSHNKQRFVISSQPQDCTMTQYVESCQKNNVRHLVCASQPTYDSSPVTKMEVNYVAIPFPDGHPPPDEVVEEWLSLCDHCKEINAKRDEVSMDAIAVHCIAGLGRSPVLVGIALIEDGLDFQSAIDLICAARHGALNTQQKVFLAHYRTREIKAAASCGCWG